MPSSIRRRGARNCTDCDRRANRECDQGFSHHATSIPFSTKIERPAFDVVPTLGPLPSKT
jgi:hypothetical protein